MQMVACTTSTPLNSAPIDDRTNGKPLVVQVVQNGDDENPINDNYNNYNNAKNNGNTKNPQKQQTATNNPYNSGNGIYSNQNPPIKNPNVNLYAAQNGKVGFYTAMPGDTVMQVGRNTGENWRDIIKWNNLEAPFGIEVGQVLKVSNATGGAGVGFTPQIASNGLGNGESVVVSQPKILPPSILNSNSNSNSTASIKTSSTVLAKDDEVIWSWPAAANITTRFDGKNNKGLKITGKAGTPILAAADGQVVYAGNKIRGYGNVVILKNSASYITAYAHNQTLLVKENEWVHRGQRIAEMGSTDANKVLLHFELRRNSVPVDPEQFLPQR